MKIRYLIIAFLLVQSILVFAGIEWQTKSTTTPDGKDSNVTTMQCYAQNGNVREEVIDIKGKDSSGFKKGSYFLYQGNSDKVTIVDTNKKTYTELPLEGIMNMMGQIADIKVSNVKVTTTKLADEQIGTYPCQHVRIDSSYDMETKIAFITSSNHIEQSQEIWGTDKISSKDFASLYKNKAFKTSIKDLDQMIEKQAAAYKNINFVLKMVMNQKTNEISNPKSVQGSTTQMTIEKLDIKQVSDDVFKIPADYKHTESGKVDKDDKKATDKDKDKEEKQKDIKPEDILKGLFN